MRRMTESRSLLARLEFLKFVAASPYVAAAGGIGAFLRLPGAAAQTAGAPAAELITDAASALNVFDFEEVGEYARWRRSCVHCAGLEEATN